MSMRIKSKKLSRSGAILVEALLATIILSISITLIVQSMTSSMRAFVYSSDYSMAILLAENKLFEAMKDGFIESGKFENRSFPHPYEKFKYILKTKKASYDSDSVLNELSLKVFWKKGTRENAIVFDTYLLEPPEDK